MGDVAVSSRPARVAPVRLILRFADVGVATYASLRQVGAAVPVHTWVIKGDVVTTVLAKLAAALPVPGPDESPAEAALRALDVGALATPASEFELAGLLGTLLPAAVWELLAGLDVRPTLHVAPAPSLARVPFPLAAGPDGVRLIELADLALVAPTHAVHLARPASRSKPSQRPVVLILDPRVPGALPDSPLGSVFGRPDPASPLTAHFAERVAAHAVRPVVAEAVSLFRRRDTDREWLSQTLREGADRLLFVGHVTAAPGDLQHAERAALHLCCADSIPGQSDTAGPHRPFTALDLLAEPERWPMPPRVAVLACESGGDYGFEEANGLTAALVVAGAQLITVTLWPLPTGRGRAGGLRTAMADLVAAVDTAHAADDALGALGDWQRGMLARWRDGDPTASPVWWSAIATVTVAGAR